MPYADSDTEKTKTIRLRLTDIRDENWRDLDWSRFIPFMLFHLACIGVIWVGWSPVAVGVAIALYFLRMFAITGWYHRYFSHRTFRTSRAVQFIFAIVGNAAAQRGPLWWAAHHRHHHRHSDEEDDVHSPHRQGFWWSHLLWISSHSNYATNYKAVHDLAKYPELRFLDRYHMLVPFLLAVAMLGLGAGLNAAYPSLGTSGLQMLVWGYFVSTIVLLHATVTINSLAHVWGNRRYETSDQSRNNFWLALITLGEGWHNNHHHYPGSVRQGFYWWEIDISYYLLRVMAWLGLVWDLNAVPTRVYEKGSMPQASAEAGGRA